MTETRVGHWMRDDCDVYVGRGRGGARFGSADIGERGWLGNPYRADEHGREECIEMFRSVFERRLSDDEEFREAIRDLAGQTLGCFCQTLDEGEPACHAEVVAEHADRLAAIRADGSGESGIEREDVSVSADDGDAVIGVGGAEIRLTVRTDGRERLVELDHHGEGPYWLIVGEREDGNEEILGEVEPVFDPAEDGDRDE